MKKVTISALAIGALVVSSVSTQARFLDTFTNYTDVSVFEHFGATDPLNNIFVPTPLSPNAVNNTFADAAGTTNINAYATDGDAATFGPGFRWFDASKPGGGSDRAFEADSYFFRSDYSPFPSPDGYTVIGGLTPGVEYIVGMWSIIGGTKDTVSTSLDFGATWSGPIDQPVLENNAIPAGTGDWLVHSTVDALGTPMAAKDGDTRYRILLHGSQVANGVGEVIVGFRDPNLRSTGGSSDRGRIDGFAVREIPEPTTIALAGLSVAGLLFRRRNRA